MILKFYRRGVEGGREQRTRGQGTGALGCVQRQDGLEWQACVECAAEGTGGRQLLLDFEEDRICIVRQVQRNGCIGGTRPWSTPEFPGNDDCA